MTGPRQPRCNYRPNRAQAMRACRMYGSVDDAAAALHVDPHLVVSLTGIERQPRLPRVTPTKDEVLAAMRLATARKAASAMRVSTGELYNLLRLYGLTSPWRRKAVWRRNPGNQVTVKDFEDALA